MMSRSRIIVLLVASHALVLVAAWLYLAPVSRGGLGGWKNLTGAGSHYQPVRLEPTAPSPVAPASAAPPVIVFKTNAFHWSQVESGDYRKYIANLRSIGCPEQTIKDFIITDILKHFALRRGELKDNGRAFRYWETNEKRALTAKQLAEREKELAKIDKEVPAILRELLGVNYQRELERYFVDTRGEDKRLGFLNEAKRGQVLTVRDMVEEMREKLLEKIGDQPPTSAQAERLRAINDLHSGLLAQSLSPAEAELYELTMSETAERLRGQLVGFEPTEEEFKKIFRLWRDFDDRYAFAGPEANAKREAEQRELEQQVKATLGAGRAADYERALNPGYRELVTFAQIHELPGATAQAIFEMRAAALDVRAQLLANSQIKGDAREAGLKALQDEVESSIRATLGPNLYRTFTQGAGAWVNSLATVR